MQCYLVCFDISDDRARNRVGKVLLRHGHRVQKSFFEIMIDGEVLLERIRHQVESLLDDEVEVRFYRLCLDCRKQSFRLDDAALASFPAVLVV